MTKRLSSLHDPDNCCVDLQHNSDTFFYQRDAKLDSLLVESGAKWGAK